MILTEEEKKELRTKLRLSRQQAELVAALLDGVEDSTALGLRIGAGPNTVKAYLRMIYAKTGTSSRLGLALLAMEVVRQAQRRRPR